MICQLELYTTLIVLVLISEITAIVYLKYCIGGAVYMAKGEAINNDFTKISITDGSVIKILTKTEFEIFNNQRFNELLKKFENKKITVNNFNYLVYYSISNTDFDLATKANQSDEKWLLALAKNLTHLGRDCLQIFLSYAQATECRLSPSLTVSGGPQERKVFSKGIYLIEPQGFDIANYSNLSTEFDEGKLMMVKRSKVVGKDTNKTITQFFPEIMNWIPSNIKFEITLDYNIPVPDFRWWRFKTGKLLYNEGDTLIMSFEIENKVKCLLGFYSDVSKEYIYGSAFNDVAENKLHIYAYHKFVKIVKTAKKNNRRPKTISEEKKITSAEFAVGKKMEINYVKFENVEPSWQEIEIVGISQGETTWPLTLSYT